jgi:NADH pyrophosphatase NudC (nudix superfamily)
MSWKEDDDANRRAGRRSWFVIGNRSRASAWGDDDVTRRNHSIERLEPVTWDQVTLEMLAAVSASDSYRVCDCGAIFISHHTARYCSAKCQTKARRPKRVQIKCENCKRPIVPHASSRETRRFCTVACKQQDYRRRRKTNNVTLTA